MIDLKALRDDPTRFKQGAADKQMQVDIDRILALDTQRRELMTRQETLRAEQKKIAKESGPKIGQLAGKLKTASGDDKAALEAEIAELKSKPATLKAEIQTLEESIIKLTPELDTLLLEVPQPADDDVPRGKGAEDNVPVSHWEPSWWDRAKTFEANKGFAPKTHIQLVHDLDLVDFERGVKIAGTRNYILKGDGMRLHQAVLRFAFDYMVNENGFAPRSVPVLVREEAMLGTGFFPHGKDQSYHIEESARGGGHDMYLTGTGEVGLMGIHQGEILDEADLPLKYVTVSPCFRREAGAAGKDTAGLYRIHSFDKVEQVIITRADEAESRQWHKKMLGFVETLLQRLELPYRLLQCCTGDLGVKNADMIDIECWMPGRGNQPHTLLDDTTNYVLKGTGSTRWCNVRPSELKKRKQQGHAFSIVVWTDSDYVKVPYEQLMSGLTDKYLHRDPKHGDRWIIHINDDGILTIQSGDAIFRTKVSLLPNNVPGDWGETHSASRLYDFQCRRLNTRYRAGGEGGQGQTVFCHSLNNTVLASPRFLIPLLEMHQNADGSVTIPEPLRPYMNNQERIG